MSQVSAATTPGLHLPSHITPVATPRPRPQQQQSFTSSSSGRAADDARRTATTTDDRVPVKAPRKAPSSPALDEIRSAVERDVVREEHQRRNQLNHSHHYDQHSAVRRIVPPPLASPSSPASPTMISAPRAAARQPTDHHHSTMPRHASIDSTASGVSTSTATSLRPHGSSAYRVSQDTDRPQDVGSLIAAAGSAEAAIQKLVGEKQQAASHNAQLWRLVEKQRAMILGLNKDLEKSLKEKERYRRKLKDSIQQSESAPALMSLNRQEGDLGAREDSQSPATLAERSLGPAMLPSSMRDFSLDSRKVSDSSDVASLSQSRSDTPQDASQSSSGLPATPQSASSAKAAAREIEQSHGSRNLQPHPLDTSRNLPTTSQHAPAGTPPISPGAVETPTHASASSSHYRHQKSPSTSSAISPTATTPSFSSPKGASRKAPPAPLQLSPPPSAVHPMNNIVDASDSEYEEDPDSARAEQMLRGRRKTREEDDRERDAAAREELEHRSRSKKDSKKIKSKPPSEQTEINRGMSGSTAAPPAVAEHIYEQKVTAPAYQSSADPLAILRQRAIFDSAGMLQKSNTAPALLSPGLPMSPRPGDRPMNSPMPRAPNKLLNSIPMSPKSSMAGLPLSPRAPRHAIPLPSQTPLAAFLTRDNALPIHLKRDMENQASLADRLMVSPESSPDVERPSLSSDPKTPGEVYTGFMTEQYPDLLLPPNALALTYIKTSSSRMRPSRQSFIAPKTMDENPVLTLAVHARSDDKQLWRMEKTFAALATFDTQIKSVCTFRDHLPDRTIFAGHSPAKIDARRSAVDMYLERMLDCVINERAANVVCRFLSADAIGADGCGDYFGAMTEARPDSPVSKQRPHRAGFLTKRGKNFGGWKARYFVLDGPNLRYFEAPGGAHLGVIKLQNAQIGKQSTNSSQNAQEDEDNQFRHAFLILEPKKKDSSSLVRHVLCAESDQERDMWVDALLAYVDYQDGDDDSSNSVKGAQVSGPHISTARSPRLQKSFGDLRPPSRNKDPKADLTRGVSYNDTVAGEAPIIGSSSGSPLSSQDPTFPPRNDSTSSHLTISSPTNLKVIQNAEDWGKTKAPPTPSTKDFSKDHNQKKRGFFASTFNTGRGRSSSDLKDSIGSPALHHDHYPRAVFGIALAEAVKFARLVDVATDLPAVVYRCLEYLTVKNAVAEEGIFRLSGSNTVIKALKDRFNTEGDVNLVTDENYYDIHAVASLLKTYLRELPASILTRDLHLEFLSCLEVHGRDKLVMLNILVNKLPMANFALLQALSAFLLSVVSNADVNKMNVRNVGIVFAPTLNVPAPLISSFVEDQHFIFGPPIDEAESPISARDEPTALPSDLRSPRKQMFSQDLPTPAYNQTSFQSFGAIHGSGNETGFTPMQPSYSNYQMAPQGDGGYGSLNDALRSPTVYNTAANGTPTPRDVKSRRRESAMMMLTTNNQGPQHKPSMSKLREEEGASF